MAHFKISLAGQLHFAPQAGDWSSPFVLFFFNCEPMQTSTALFPTVRPCKKKIVARLMEKKEKNSQALTVSPPYRNLMM